MAKDAPAEPKPSDDPLVGSKIGKYELLRKRGQGGMGRVYEALNPTIGKRVALKLLDPRLAAAESMAARFTREAQAASAASSPHIVEIFDAGIAEDGSPFIVMELLQGEPLSSLLDRGPLSAEETCRIAVQVLRGLQKAHAAGIVHRDLKPDNVFLVDREHEPPLAKILDFGVSKLDKSHGNTTLTREGTVIGTAAYMSPEQAQGQAEVDARSDIWSVGAILYECLSGCLPFTGSSYEQIIVRICTTTAKPLSEVAPSVPAELADVVGRCLRRDRDERVASADELLTLLGATATSGARSRSQRPVRSAGASTSIGTDSTVEAPGVQLRAETSAANRLAFPIAGLVLAIGVGVVVWSWDSSGTGAGPSPEASPVSPTAATAESPRAPEPEPEPPAPSVSATASASASASLSAPVPPVPPPALVARPRRPPPPPSAGPPPPPPPPRKGGIAGDLTPLPE